MIVKDLYFHWEPLNDRVEWQNSWMTRILIELFDYSHFQLLLFLISPNQSIILFCLKKVAHMSTSIYIQMW